MEDNTAVAKTGRPRNKEPYRVYSVVVPLSVAEKLQADAQTSGMTMSATMVRAIRGYYDNSEMSQELLTLRKKVMEIAGIATN